MRLGHYVAAQSARRRRRASGASASAPLGRRFGALSPAARAQGPLERLRRAPLTQRFGAAREHMPEHAAGRFPPQQQSTQLDSNVLVDVWVCGSQSFVSVDGLIFVVYRAGCCTLNTHTRGVPRSSE